MYACITWPVGGCVAKPTAVAVAAAVAIYNRDAELTTVTDGRIRDELLMKYKCNEVAALQLSRY